MRTNGACWAMATLLSLGASAGGAARRDAAQTGTAVPITSEPHHHLVLDNDSVKAYKVEVGPHESTLLHQHDHDYVFIVIGDAQVTSAIPGKAEAHLELSDGEVHLSRGGFAHVARNEGDHPFRNVTIELLRPQGELHNLCVQEVAREPVVCPGPRQSPGTTPARTDSPQFETDATRVILTRVPPHQKAALPDSRWEELIVALDEAVIAFAAGKGPERLLRPGDLLWLGRGGVARLLKNDGDKEARFIVLEMRPSGSGETKPGPATGPIVGAPLVPHDLDTLMALEYKWMNARDRQTFEEIWADDYEDASEKGRFTKGQILSRPAPPPPPAGGRPAWTEKLEDVHARFYDTISVVTGRVERRDSSGKTILQTQFTDVFHWENGRWRAVSSQETRVEGESVAKP